MSREKIFAWCVHMYTALGLIAAAMMAVLIVRGDEISFRRVIALMIIATFIDSTDGWFARRARVRQVVPEFDGRRLDDIVDYLNYTALPIFFIWKAEVVSVEHAWWLLLPLMASAYGFSQTNAKTADHYFLGFPSYWNVIAIYLYWLAPLPGVSLGVIVMLSLLTFVPSYYLYPSRGGPLARLTVALCSIWAVLLVMIVAGAFADPRPAVWISLLFPVYYFVFSWLITLRHWRAGRDRSRKPELSGLVEMVEGRETR